MLVWGHLTVGVNVAAGAIASLVLWLPRFVLSKRISVSVNPDRTGEAKGKRGGSISLRQHGPCRGGVARPGPLPEGVLDADCACTHKWLCVTVDTSIAVRDRYLWNIYCQGGPIATEICSRNAAKPNRIDSWWLRNDRTLLFLGMCRDQGQSKGTCTSTLQGM